MRFIAELILTPDREKEGIHAIIRCDFRHPELEERLGQEFSISRYVLRDHEFAAFEDSVISGLRQILSLAQDKVMAERKMRAKSGAQIFGEIIELLDTPPFPASSGAEKAGAVGEE